MPYLVTATWDDVPHLTEKQKSDLWASIPAHERDARSKGIPTLGSGLIFPVAEEDIVVEPFALPRHWPQIGGMDFGYDHPFAAVKLAHDRDNDVVYVAAEYRKSQATPVIHAAALKPWGAWLPWAWPHDGLRKDKDASGKEYSALYREQGLAMLAEKATFEDGGNGVEAGLIEMLDRMQTGRWKVFSTCRAWLEERRLYHRRDGVVVKERDDALSASRYAFMTLERSDFENARRIVETAGIERLNRCDRPRLRHRTEGFRLWRGQACLRRAAHPRAIAHSQTSPPAELLGTSPCIVQKKGLTMANAKPWYLSITFLAGVFFVLQGFGLAGVNIDFQTGDFSGNIYELWASISSMVRRLRGHLRSRPRLGPADPPEAGAAMIGPPISSPPSWSSRCAGHC